MKNSGHLVLSELIAIATIKLALTSTNTATMLDELVGQIPEIANQPEARRKILQALQERERLHSTGIGDGIALPHARDALVGIVDRPMIIFGRHPTGIEYGAIDGVPARLFFLLIAPTVTQHLAVLAQISRLLRDSKLRQDLLAAQKPGEVIELIRAAERGMGKRET